MIGEEFVFLFFLYIKLLELGVEIAFNNRSAITLNKVNLLKFPLLRSCSKRTIDVLCAAHLLLLLLPLGTPCPCLLTVKIQILKYIGSAEPR